MRSFEMIPKKNILREFVDDRGTPKALPLDRDLIFKAKNKYPAYDSQQALTLYIADQMTDQLKIDSDQNKVINAHKSENQKLTNVINALGDELHDYERQSQETDREVERLKQISSRLSPDNVATQQKAKISADELEKREGKMQNDLEALKSKPGMDQAKYEKMAAEVNKLMTSPNIDHKKVNELEKIIDTLLREKTIDSKNYQLATEKLKAAEETNAGITGELDAKEVRFKKYIDKKTKEAAKAMKGFDKFNDFMNQERENILNLRGATQEEADQISTQAAEISAEAKRISTQAAEIDKMFNDLKTLYGTEPIEGDNAVAAGIRANDVISKAKTGELPTPTPTPTAGATDPDQLNKYDTHAIPNLAYGNVDVKDTDAPELDVDVDDSDDHTYKKPKPKSRLSKLSEDFKMYKMWNDADFNMWMRKNLPKLLSEFKLIYRYELSQQHPRYSDEQIVAELQETADDLLIIFNRRSPTKMSDTQWLAWFAKVKNSLFNQPSLIAHQPAFQFSESLDKTFARMLDTIIDLPYIKKG